MSTLPTPNLTDIEVVYEYLRSRIVKPAKVNITEKRVGFSPRNISILKSNSISVRIYENPWHNKYQSYDLRKATQAGGYGRIKRSIIQKVEDLDSLIKEVTDAKIVERSSTRLEIFEFKEAPGLRPHPASGHVSRADFVIYNCRVMGVVRVDDDGYIQDALYGDHDCIWFEMDCANKLGATFNILYDGEDNWTPIKRYGKKRITGSMKPKSSVQLDNISTGDKDILDLAVQIWLTNGGYLK